MSKLDEDYKGLLGSCLYNGIEKQDRTGTGTLSVFGRQIRHNMEDGFPLLTTKSMAIKTLVTELKWFLKGRTDIQYLRDNNCKIWDGDYEKSGNTNGDLGPIYRAQWRSWRAFGHTIDQLKELVEGLKNNPDGRRHLVTAWNPGDMKYMVLPPCHYSFQCYVADGKLSLMWNQRSVDTFLGLPFNIASYGLLLLLLCEETGYKPGELIGNLGDVHLYSNHLEQAKEQITRDPFELSTIKLSNVDILNGEFDYEISNYECHPSIKAPLSN